MAQAKKKTATRTAKKTTAARKTKQQQKMCYQKYEFGQKPNTVFVITMTFLAATLLFANIVLMIA